MEQKTIVKENENGSYEKTVVTKTTPDDGFIHQPEINKTDRTNYGEYHKGYQINKHYETDNPKIVIPFLIGFMIIMLLFPLGAYIFNGFGTLFFLFLLLALLFDVLILKEIIGVVKKNKK